MEELIIWKNIKEVTPKEGQLILYSYTYEWEPGEWEHRVRLDRYYHSEMCKYPMCYMTHWADAPCAPTPEVEDSEVCGMNSTLYNVISDCFDSRSKQSIVDEVNKILEVLEAEDRLYLSPIEFIGFEFELNTTSWQVLEANANGHYIVEQQDDECKDHYYIRNLDTNKVYSTDERTLKYLMSHTDCQDYKFIYVGSRGDYEYIGI